MAMKKFEVDPFDLLEVKRWPTLWRRMFIILLPVSAPLWVIYLFALVGGCMLIFAIEILNAQEGARKHCTYPSKPCRLVKNEPDNWEELDWWPALKCTVCGKEFDL